MSIKIFVRHYACFSILVIMLKKQVVFGFCHTSQISSFFSWYV